MSKIRTCKWCGKQLEKKDKKCPVCGKNVKKHTILLILVILFVVFGIIGALSEGEDTANETKQITIEDEIINVESTDNQSTIVLSEPINENSVLEINQQSLDYRTLTESTWVGQGDKLLVIASGLQDIKLTFSGNRMFTLILTSVKEKRNEWQHTGQYEISDEKIIFSLKRGEKLYGKIKNNIMTISNWDFGEIKTFELIKR
jgi:hypothetical protein